ncbi:cytochrome b/b6 domain-containing protein [Variovorax rhizosphaerae]|uniref:Cytochrome b/b6 domain-containing protein n=1 Tax=Variovorax rhizosphaerae TaxID=1836200 RepID=A0ABU8WIY0_9BURK
MSRLEGAWVRTWSVLQRLLHWCLVAGIVVAWCFGEERQTLHNGAGYLALAAVAVRVLLGLAGGGNAGFASFVRAPAAVLRYAGEVLRGRERRYLGHNPLGGWMVVALLACTLVACLTGWLYTLDAFWGMAWLDLLHRGAAWAVLGLACIHVSAVLWMSWRHRENLAASMVTGRKRATVERRGP